MKCEMESKVRTGSMQATVLDFSDSLIEGSIGSGKDSTRMFKINSTKDCFMHDLFCTILN